MGSVCGGLIAIGTTWIVPLLMRDTSFTSYLIGAGVGAILFAMVLLQIYRGASCCVDLDGVLWYGFGKHPCISFPLSKAKHLRMIEEPPLVGIGVEIDVESITILHRKGVSYAKMRDWEKRCGCGMILEFFSEDDRDDLMHLRRQLRDEIGSNPRFPALREYQPETAHPETNKQAQA